MSLSNQIILTVESLGIRRSERWLFRDLSFKLNAGNVMQVVGLNGAGKTSLLRSLCGLLPHAEGDFTWCGDEDNPCYPIFLGHLPAVKPELTVLENLLYHPLAGKFSEENEIEDAVAQVKLDAYVDTLARSLSAGQTRRVGLARLLLSKTKCWVLDEPFTSLDVAGCAWLENQIDQFAKEGGAVLLTSHQPVNLAEPPKLLELNSQVVDQC